MNKYLNLSTMLAVQAALTGFDSYMHNERISYEPSPMTQPKPKGKIWVINGVEIPALNYKNALRKYNNR